MLSQLLKTSVASANVYQRWHLIGRGGLEQLTVNCGQVSGQVTAMF